jgi:hypothetical protein
VTYPVGSKILIHNAELTYEALVVDDYIGGTTVCLTKRGQPIYFAEGSTKSSGERFFLGALPGSLVLLFGGSFIRLGPGQSKLPADRDVSR